MCSVLLGLGLILIGGLLFAINVDDDADSSKSDYDTSSQVSTKAPSHFTGPVLMGIGGFIVIMGIIMCLFETQVCRKRTGDASPLISEKADDSEKKDSEPTAVPSTSHAHKGHRHGARRTSASPRKSKNRHAKSHSKERNPDKKDSSKSPPIPVEPSKNFMTSSEENFLTPPNTLQEKASTMKNHETPSIEDSSLMKSFTSSGPSWNQSSEFLTPSSSFRGTPISLNKSVEIEKSQEDSNFKTTELSLKQNVNSEYMSPLTVEEDRIQQLLIRVKNEQKQMADSEKASNFEPSVHLRSEKSLSSSHDKNEGVNKENEEIKKLEKGIKCSNELVSETHQDPSVLKNTNQVQDIQIENEIENQNKIEPNALERNHKAVNNVVVTEISNEIINAEKEKNIFQLDNQQAEISPQISSSEIKDLRLVPCIEKGTSDDIAESNNEQVDLESSVSSAETVVSPDSIQENRASKEASIEGSSLAISEANSNNESKCVPTLESPPTDITVESNKNVDHRNIDADATKEEAGAHDLNLNANSNVEVAAIDVENASTVKIS